MLFIEKLSVSKSNFYNAGILKMTKGAILKFVMAAAHNDKLRTS